MTYQANAYLPVDPRHPDPDRDVETSQDRAGERVLAQAVERMKSLAERGCDQTGLRKHAKMQARNLDSDGARLTSRSYASPRRNVGTENIR